MTLPVTRIAQQNTVRLISSGRLKPSVLQPLAANHGALEDLETLESATNGRLRGQASGLPELSPSELVFGRPGETFINAAFLYTRAGGNRFNDENRGAWYCAFEVDTALAEVAFHLTRELRNIGRFENTTDYAELFADFIGEFHDARGVAPPPAYLHEDPAVGYPAGQGLARELRAHQSPGLIYPSVRRRDGTCLVAFIPNVVQNFRQGGLWRLEWQDTAEPVITKDPRTNRP